MQRSQIEPSGSFAATAFATQNPTVAQFVCGGLMLPPRRSWAVVKRTGRKRLFYIEAEPTVQVDSVERLHDVALLVVIPVLEVNCVLAACVQIKVHLEPRRLTRVLAQSP